MAREQARKDLPLSTYTESYWKIDLHNLLHFLGLRADSHAQEEIRAYATLIGEQVVSRWVPLTWEAYLDYRAGGLLLTRAERDIAACLNAGRPQDALRIAEQAGWLRRRTDPPPGATGSRTPAPQPGALRGGGQARRAGADRALAHCPALTSAAGGTGGNGERSRGPRQPCASRVNGA